MIESVVRNVVDSADSSALRGGGGTTFTPAQLSNLVQRFLDANPTYHNTLLQSLPIITPEETGTVAVPRGQRCALFDGVDDYLSLAHSSGLNVGDTFTICMWVKRVGTGTQQCLFNKGASSGIYIGFLAGGTVEIGRSGAAMIARTSAAINSTSIWTHVAITKSGGTVKIYFNGVDQSLVAGTAYTFVDNTSPITIGRDETGNFALSAYVHTPGYFNVAKSASEIAAIYNQASTPSTIDTTGLVGMWPLQEESGTTAYDISGNGKHLTLTNITQATFHATDSGVTYNYNNWKGHTLSGNVVIPASLSTPSQDAAGNALGVAGPVAHPVTMEVSCFTGDGSAAYVDCGSALIPATADFSMSLWYYHVTNNTTRRTVLSQCDSGAPSGRMDLTANSSSGAGTAGALELFINGGIDVNLASALTAGSWHYLTISRVGNTFTLNCTAVNGSLVTGNQTASVTIYTGRNTWLLAADSGSFIYNDGRLVGLYITTGGVTKYPLFDQCGPGTSNTNRDFYILGSDGSATLVSGGIVNGTIANIYANRCPYVKDWCIQYGGSCNPNMLSYTNTFTNAAWTKVTATLTANDLAGPDGVVNATKIVFANSTSEVSQQITASATSRSISIYVKGTTGETIRVGDGSGTATVFTLTGNWDRLTVITSASNPYLSINTYGGSTARTIWVRDAQLELGSVVTPYQANATTPNGSFIPGRIGSANDAAGNAKTLTAGKHGNPYSRLVPNYWSAPELVNIGYTSSSKLAPSTTVQATSPADTKFARIKAAGSDRYFATLAALTGSNKTNAESYVG